MRSLADVHGYRGVEYCVYAGNPGDWEWKYYPKVGEGIATGGRVSGTRENAIAACKVAIDDWLGPKTSN